MRRFAVVAVCLLAACTTGHTAGPTVDSNATDPEAFTPPSADASTVPDDVSSGKCGVERWDVKTGTDTAAANVNTTPKTMKIKDLAAKRSQLDPNNQHAPRSTDEQQTYTIKATLSGYKLEGDSDLHLVITDGTDHMIVEIPSPSCVKKTSPFAAQIAKTRADFLAKTRYKPPAPGAQVPFVRANLPVTVTGVLFYDFLHGQTGVAPNGAELHPLTGITFG